MSEYEQVYLELGAFDISVSQPPTIVIYTSMKLRITW